MPDRTLNFYNCKENSTHYIALVLYSEYWLQLVFGGFEEQISDINSLSWILKQYMTMVVL